MGRWIGLGVLCLFSGTVLGGGGSPLERYQVDLDLRKFPQTSPEQALASVVQAVNTRNFTYLIAQLADPEYVDARVEEYRKELKGAPAARTLVAFDRLVREVAQHFQNDPSLGKELRRFAKEGKWKQESETRSACYLADVASRRAVFRQIKGRWFLENRLEVSAK
jgi:hypothetical protein